MMTTTESHALLTRFSQGKVSAIEVRKFLGGVTYGDLFQMLADARLTLPRPSSVGREDQLARARAWMFPRHAD